MKRKWKTAFLTILDYRTMAAQEVIDSLRQLGYEGIEWTTDHFDPDKPMADLKELVQRTHDAGMEISQIMAHDDLISLDDQARHRKIDRIVRVIEAAGTCGVGAVSVLTGPAIWEPGSVRIGEDMSTSVAWSQAIEAFEAFVDAAESASVIITSEAVYGMMAHDFYTHKWLVDQVDRPAHKVNFDPSHHVLYGIEDMGWLIHQWGDRIAHVHIKDGIGVPELNKFVFPMLGEGRVHWLDFFTALDEIDYRGFCSLEFESFRFYRQVLKNDPEAAARISMEQLRGLLAETK